VAPAAAAAGVGEVFGLNKSAKVFLAGEAVGAAAAGVVIADFFREAFEAGSTGAGEALAAAAGAAVAAAFLRDFFAGEADASAAGDSLAPGEASAAFLRDFLAGEAEASGEEAGEGFSAGDGD